MQRIIAVCDYQDHWPQLYAEESALIKPVFGSDLLYIEHIGSTSIPNMRAKPVIDILVVVKPASDIPSFYNGMKRHGYDCRGECLDAPFPGTPGRYYFSKNKNGIRHSHVHVCHAGHREIKDYLAFREYLRAHPDMARDYGNLKAELASKYSHDNFQYMMGKNDFVKDLIRKSLIWYGA
jgi:GrpB-like predicted nucleotidyltransferase (UPF0157 family)